MASRCVVALALGLALVRIGAAAPPAKPADGSAAALQKLLGQMAEAQQWQGEQLWHVREKVNELPGVIAEAKDANTATQEEVDKLREEVKGLYVELSSVKQQIDALKGDIGGVNTNVSGFRTYSGFFIALMLLMVAVIFVMTLRR